MSEPGYNELHRQLFELYSKGSYAEALERVEQEADRFPEQESDIYYWRVCLIARLHDIPQALQAFRDAVAKGYWYAPSLLREDEDLKPLQGLAAFEQMVAVCQHRFAEVEANTRPELLVVPPEGSAVQPYPLLFALHGNMSNARSSVASWSWMTTQGWLLGAPQSSQVVGSDAYVWNDFEKGTREVQEHYAALAKEYAIEPEQVIVGGFSMGAGLATWLAVSRSIQARGFVVLGPYLPDIDVLTPFLEVARKEGVRGYIVMGELEMPEYRANVLKLAEFLNAHGIACELEWRPNLAHAFPADFEKSLEKALAFIMQE
jgi:predicted esterase